MNANRGDGPAGWGGPDLLVVGAGFIGRRVATRCAEAGRHVTLLARRPPDPAIPASVTVRLGDAGDRAVLDPVLGPTTPVVWCAGSLLPAAAPPDDPDLDLAPLELAVELLAARGGTLTFLSSGGTVYGAPTTNPVPEEHPLAPQGLYATSKVAAEQLLADVRSHGVRSTVLRCGNVYGPHQQPGRSQGVVANILGCARRGAPVPIYGDGTTVRDYVFVDDVVSVVQRSIEDPSFPDLVNVGTGVGTRLDELLAHAREVTGLELPEDRRPARTHDIPQIVLDITRLQAAMPSYQPRPLRAGLAATWQALVDGEASTR